jgi:hypothetical protein
MLVAELRERFAPLDRDWLARAPLTLEAGALDALARDADRFERANVVD